jgi:hypothetical protein
MGVDVVLSDARTDGPHYDLPGSTELHLIPRGPSAIAVLSIKLLIPALVGV